MITYKKIFGFAAVLVMIFQAAISAQTNGREIIELEWSDVVGTTLTENLSLETKRLEYKSQDLEEWKSLSSFLPKFEYLGTMNRQIEIPTVVFNGMTFQMGTPYTFRHSLTLSMPLWAGGARWFNYQMQRSLRKSLESELEGKEEETVLQSLQAYFGIILANSLVGTLEEAVEAAKQNYEQVQKFYDAGTATELDLQRAKANYYSTLPQLESAVNSKTMAYQNLKFMLNIDLEDSLVVKDSLMQLEFLADYKNLKLEEYIDLAGEYREDLKALELKTEAVGEGENLALSSFSPVVSVSADVQHQAMLQGDEVQWEDYTRSKAFNLVVSWSIFEGGKRFLDWQQAKIESKKMDILMRQFKDQIKLDVEKNYRSYLESIRNLNSLEVTMEQAKESLRLAELLYKEGMSTQVEVLDAQLFYTKSQSDYLQGIYNYNVNQLALLKSIGLINSIWE